MASLYRKPVVTVDPRTGQKVKEKSAKWWGQFKDAEGRLRRHPLAIDKMAAQAMLNELVRQVEREKAGLVDPTDGQRKRPLSEHLAEYKDYLRNKGVTSHQVQVASSQVEKIAAAAKWKRIADITSTSTLNYLGELRAKGRSAQTYNHYLKSAKSFCRWLVRDRRTPTDPLAHVSKLNVAVDRRHDRRALTADEFMRLVEAARAGGPVEGIKGPDRAMLYVLAAWTGFRKGELASLTLRSLKLGDDPPTATVAACYSKRRREDSQILHPEVVRQLKEWLAKRLRLTPHSLLFQISDRKTHKMVKLDLAAARATWVKEAKEDAAEKQRREESDFLAHKNHAGLYADFHSLRHYFITSLSRNGVSPKMAQTLARHSDIRLTLGLYTHVELHDQSAAIEALPGPPARKQDNEHAG